VPLSLHALQQGDVAGGHCMHGPLHAAACTCLNHSSVMMIWPPQQCCMLCPLPLPLQVGGRPYASQ
jgi:hypothetical protein